MWVESFPNWINFAHVSRVEVVKRRPGDEPELSLKISQPGVSDLVITDRKECDRVLAWLENHGAPKLIPAPDVPQATVVHPSKKQEKAA